MGDKTGLIIIVCIVTVFVSFKSSFLIRNKLATISINSFEKIEEIIRNDAFLKEVGYDEIRIAPKYSMLWSRLIKTTPYYLLTVDIELIRHCDKQKDIECEKQKDAKAQISFYNSPSEDEQVSYTMSLNVDGKTKDTFGVYPPRSVANFEQDLGVGQFDY